MPLALQVGLSAAELVQLAIAALGAVATLAAAIAAWRAAKATQESVAEMREMRHQSVRPAMDVQVPADVILGWGVDCPVSLGFVGSHEAPVIRVRNVGFGAALDLEAEFYSRADANFNELEEKRLERFFADSGMRFIKHLSGDGYSVWPRPSVINAADLHPFVGWLHRYPNEHVSICETGQELKVELLSNSFQLSVLDKLRRQLNAEVNETDLPTARNAHVFNDLLVLKYRSHSGELFEQRFAVRIQPSLLYQLPSWTTAPLTREWKSLSLRFDVSINPEPSP